MTGRVQSKKHLAIKAGYKSASSISKFLSGKSEELQLKFILFLAREYGVCLNWLLMGDPFIFNLNDPELFAQLSAYFQKLSIPFRHHTKLNSLQDVQVGPDLSTNTQSDSNDAPTIQFFIRKV